MKFIPIEDRDAYGVYVRTTPEGRVQIWNVVGKYWEYAEISASIPAGDAPGDTVLDYKLTKGEEVK